MTRIEEGSFGRIFIILNDPAQKDKSYKFTYLKDDGTCIGKIQTHQNGAEQTNHADYESFNEDTQHRRAVDNLRMSLTSLGEKDLAASLPKPDEPLTIYRKRV